MDRIDRELRRLQAKVEREMERQGDLKGLALFRAFNAAVGRSDPSPRPRPATRSRRR